MGKFFIITTTLIISILLILIPVNQHYESNKILTDANIVSITVTFDYFEFSNARYSSIEDTFHFLDYDKLYINNYFLEIDPIKFENVFKDMESGTKMDISYLKKSREIIELRVNDTVYISLESTESGIAEQNNTNTGLVILFIPQLFFLFAVAYISIANNF